MKKLLSLVLALMMAFSMTAFAEAAESLGIWELTGAETGGISVDVSVLGLEMTMELYADGTCVLVAMGEEEQGVWVETETGIAVTDADAATMEMILQEDGSFITEQDGMMLIFTPAEYALPLSGLTVADFNGDWTFVYAETMGQLVDAATAGIQMRIVLQDGAGHMDITDATGANSVEAICEAEEIEGVGTVLYFIYLDEAGNVTESGIPLLLYEDGELVWLYADESNEIYYCFLPTEALAAE